MANANAEPQGQVGDLRSIFDSRQTRSGSYYSPYLLSGDAYVDPNVQVDTLLFNALHLHDDPFGSPLSTPPSSRCTSPEPTEFTQLPPEVAVSVHKEPQEQGSISSAGKSSKRKRKRKSKKKAVEAERVEEDAIEESGQEETAVKQQRSHVQRQKKRQKNDPNGILFTQTDEALEQLAEKYAGRLFPDSYKTENKFPTNQLQAIAQSTGYQGNPYVGLGNPSFDIPAPEPCIYTLDELVNDGKHNFKLVCCKNGTSHITDPNTNAVIGLITTGPRNDPTWKSNADEAVKTIKRLRPQCKFPPWVYSPKDRRGPINNINWGISLGNRQPRPMELNNQGVKRKAAMEEIRQDLAFIRIALFMCMVFLTWAPKLCLYYASTMAAVLERYPQLSLPFQGCVFAAFAVNFGPQTVCLPHRDTKNLAFGWCAITALGNFNWRKGGHLVLWDLCLVIEFPPGATIFIPSALVCHFNTAIQPHEERYSFTCYTSGALFRWVDHGFRPETDYKKTPEAKLNAEQDSTRRERGFSLFSTLDELKKGCAASKQ
ncbi:hypothetical protein V5O48_010633 [Marasmius crinis-equi]|uniref:Uncharacterized protein n=1 Tax=Marasmius crinis-equi TaxID=585013 RepID=A0ABR3F7U1_9AGAR